jgi:hypothetical protein
MLKRAPTRDILYKVRELEEDNRYLITKDGIGTYLVLSTLSRAPVAAQHTPSEGTANILFTFCRSITYRLASLKPHGNLSTMVNVLVLITDGRKFCDHVPGLPESLLQFLCHLLHDGLLHLLHITAHLPTERLLTC